MKIEQAVALFQSFFCERDSKRSLRSQMMALYTPALFSNQVVLKKSLFGRISLWFSSTASQEQLNRRVEAVFKEAYSILKETNAIAQVPKAIAFASLFSDEVKEHEKMPADLEEIQNYSEEVLRSRESKKYERSLFRNRQETDVLISIEEFEEQVLQQKVDVKTLNRFIQFLKKNPHYANGRGEVWEDALKEGIAFEKKLQYLFFPDGRPTANHQEELKSIALVIQQVIHDLSPGQSWLFCGSYGPKVFSLDGLHQFMQLLPKGVAEQFPEPLAEIYKLDTLPNPLEFVKERLHQMVEILETECKNHFSSMDVSLLDFLREDKSRQLPESLARILPEVLRQPLNQKIQQGILGSTLSLLEMIPSDDIKEVLQFLMDQGPLCQDLGFPMKTSPLASLSNILRWIPPQGTKEWIQWLSQNLHRMIHPQEREEFLRLLEKKVLDSIEGYADEAKNKVNDQLVHAFRNIQGAIPHAMLDLFGLSAISSGKCWIEFCRQPNGLFTVCLYGSGAAWHLHSQDQETGNVHWPLRFLDIAPERMDTDFFHHLLRHHIETQRDASISSTAQDLYNGVIEYLGGKPEHLHLIHSQPIVEESQMLLSSLANSLINPDLALFKMHVEILQTFSQPYLRNPSGLLEIEDDKSCKAFEGALNVISREFNKVRNQIADQENEALEATFSEIQRAISKFQSSLKPQEKILGDNALNLPDEWRLHIRDHLIKQGITPAHLYSSKPFLNWALGEEIGEFIDVLVQSLELEKVPLEAYKQTEPELPKEAQGWLKKLLKNLYFRLFFEVLKTLSDALHLYRFGVTPLVLGRLLQKGIQTLLPHSIYAWYLEALQAIQRLCIEMGLRFVLNVLISKEQSEVLLKFGKDARHSIQNMIAVLTRSQVLSFDVPNSAKKIAVDEKKIQIFFEMPVDPKKISNNEQKEVKKVLGAVIPIHPFGLQDSKFIPRVEVFPEITAASALNEIKLLRKEIEKIKRYYILSADRDNGRAHSYLAISLLLKNLPFPQWGMEGIWDHVPLEIIPDLIENLGAIGSTCYIVSTPDSLKRYPEIFVEGLCLHYHLLAIIDKLARRMPNIDLTSYQVNVCPLLRWWKNDHCCVMTPIQIHRLTAIFKYFLPHMDLRNPPNDQEIDLIEKRSLFSYSFLKDLNLNFVEFEKHCKDLSIPEFEYFSRRLEEASTLEACEFLDIYDAGAFILNGLPNKIAFSQLKKEQQIRILFECSFDKKNAHKPLPQPFFYLKKQTILSNSFVSRLGKLYSTFYKIDYKLRHENRADYFYTPFNRPWEHNRCYVFIENPSHRSQAIAWIKEKFFFWHASEWMNFKLQKLLEPADAHFDSHDHLLLSHRISQSFLTGNQDPFPHFPHRWKSEEQEGSVVNFFLEDFKDFLNPSKKLASSYESGKRWSQWNSRIGEEAEAFHLIRAENKGQLIRTIEFFKQHKEKLNFQHQNFKVLLFVEAMFFRADDLQQQLSESSHLVTVLHEFFKDLFDYYHSRQDVKTQSWVIWMWSKVYLQCLEVSPDYACHNPNFLDFLDKMSIQCHEDEAQREIWLILNALCRGLPYQKEKDLEEMASWFFQANFCLRNSLTSRHSGDFTYRSFSERIKIEFAKQFYENFETFSHLLLTVPESRQRIGAAIARSQGIQNIRQEKWEYPGSIDSCLKNGEYTFYLKLGHIKKKNLSAQELFLEIKKKAATIIPSAHTLQIVDESRLATTDGCYGVELLDSENIQCYRIYQGKKYVFISQKDKEDKDDASQYWVEVTEAPIKELLQFKQGEEEPHVLLISRQEEDASGFSVYGFKKGDEYFENVDPRGILEPLSRFCPVSRMHCMKKRGEHHLSSFFLSPWMLGFNVQKNEEGNFHAYSTLFPGFRIAQTQRVASLSKFSSYLLLENERGQRKVLLPASNWVGMFAWRHFSEWGILREFVYPWLMENISKDVDKEFYVYDLDKKGNFHTEDPKGLVHLIITYLISGQVEHARGLCGTFAMICRRDRVESLEYLLILLCLLPFDESHMASIRQQMMSAYEENQLLRPVEKEANQAKSIPELFMVICLFVNLKALAQDKKNRKINHYQEWFLYQGLFRRVQLLIRSHGGDYVNKITGKMGWDLIADIMGFSAQMVKRYRQLGQILGKKEGWIEKGLNFYNQVQNIPLPSAHRIQPLFEAPSLHLRDQALHLFKGCLSTCYINPKIFNVEEVAKKISLDKDPFPPLCLEDLNAEIFVRKFLSYYAIARGEGSKQAHQQLQRLLPLLKGGWNGQTRILVEYLQLAMAHPYLCWGSDKFRKDPVLFFQHLHYRSIALVNVSQGLTFLGSLVLQPALREAVYQHTPGLGGIPVPSVVSSLLNFSARLGTRWLNSPKTEETQPIKKEVERFASATSYIALQVEDQKVDAFLKQLFDVVFEEIPATKEQIDAQKRVEPFENGKNEPKGVRVRKERVNQNIEAFYASYRGHLQTRFKLKDSAFIWTIYFPLKTFYKEMKTQWKKEQERILASVNCNVEEEKISFDELRKAFLDADFQAICSRSQLNLSIMQHLEMSLARHFVKQGRLNQLKSILKSIEDISQLSPLDSKEKYEDLLEQLAIFLKTTRSYALNEFSSGITRGFLVYEALARVLLWQRQVDRFKEMVRDLSGSKLFELLMSLGKTDVLGPLFNFVLADGESIIFNTFPKQVAMPNIRQMSQKGEKILARPTNTFFMDRQTSLTKERLDGFLVLMEKARDKKEIIATIKEDAQAFELRFIEELFYRAFPEQGTPTLDDGALTSHQQALWKIRKNGKNIGDEGHEILASKDELNYPIGKESTVNKGYYLAIEECLRCIYSHSLLKKLITSNDLEALKNTEYQQKIRSELALTLSRWPTFQIRGDQVCEQEFVDFVCEKRSMPDWIKQSSYCKQICMVKGVLTDLFPLLLGKRVSIHYGEGKEGFAKPYAGNNNRLEDSIIQMVYEAVVKTFVTVLHDGLKFEQVKSLVSYLQNQAKMESDKFNKSIFDTKAYVLFSKLFQKNDLMLFFKQPEETVEVAISQAMRNPEVIFCYLRFFVWEKMKYWKWNLSSNALHYHSMFQRGYYQTGTPYNDVCYPPDVRVVWDLGTIGEALHIIFNKCPENGIRLLEGDPITPQEILHSTLQMFFQQGSHFTALIDGGGQLVGIKGLDVAKQMLAFCKDREDIRAVVFFEKDANGKDQLVYLEKGAGKSEIFESGRIPPEAYLSYFDQSHGFAANIEQKIGKAKAVNLIGRDNMLFKECQEDFRMRGLKKWKRVISSETETNYDPLEGVQEIHFAMTKETQKEISGDHLPTRREIFEYAIRNEGLKMSEEESFIYLKKLKNIIRRKVLDKILEASIKDAVQILKEFFQVFINTMEDDPEKLYGKWRGFVPPSESLWKEIREETFSVVSKSKRFTPLELLDIQKLLEEVPIPATLESVKVVLDGKEMRIDFSGQQLGMEATLSLQNQQNQEIDFNQEMDQELNQQLEQQVNVQHPSSVSSIFQEDLWDPTLDPYSTDWQRFSSEGSIGEYLEQITPRWIREKKPRVPLFKLQDLLKMSKSQVLQKIVPKVDSRLWCSNNFLPRRMASLSDKKIEFGSLQQRALFEVLVDFEEVGEEIKILSVGCLSIKDAAFWREKLHKTGAQPPVNKMKRMLYNVHLRMAVAGDIPPLEKIRECGELQNLEMQLIFLNGETKFPKEHVPHLKAWIKEDEREWRQGGRVKMYEAAKHLFFSRGKGNFTGSLLDQVFNELFYKS